MAQEVAGSRPAPTKESIADWARATLEPMGGTVVVDRQFVEVELPAEKLRAAARATRRFSGALRPPAVRLHRTTAYRLYKGAPPFVPIRRRMALTLDKIPSTSAVCAS